MNVWIHGHIHDSLDFMTSYSRIGCNPWRFVTFASAAIPDFDTLKIVEI